MDHQAFAQILGNYGEFVGAIAVVVTLGYLAVQVRQTKKIVTSSVRESRNNGTRELFLAMATSGDLAQAWTKAEEEMDGQPFMNQRTIIEETAGVDPSDAQRAMAYAIGLYFHYRTMYYADLGEADRYSLDVNIKRFFSNGIGALLMNQYPDDEFVKYAQEILEHDAA
jgi:hypothetical protein